MKFLIVDDDLSMCQLMTFYLANYARCFSATLPGPAWRLFTDHIKTEPFSAVFMDIEMPGMKGYELVELFRTAEKNYNIPKQDAFKLVMVSAHGSLENINASLYRSKAYCFIKKPFTRDSLLRQLQENRVF